ncbi:hypothetical protein ACIBF7_12200, partial [Nonomuraea sp. NPDC050478]|uniref:hypothetical protein n=1 Tax=Nonomuraea sp. NPDC050478 TaxID=3364365 RepID=UPI00379719BA
MTVGVRGMTVVGSVVMMRVGLRAGPSVAMTRVRVPVVTVSVAMTAGVPAGSSVVTVGVRGMTVAGSVVTTRVGLRAGPSVAMTRVRVPVVTVSVAMTAGVPA